MSSDTSRTRTRPHLGRIRRVALSAAAVVVGAIVLSGCVVIQSDSAQQANVIGNSVIVTTVLCASNTTAAAPCNSLGNQAQAAQAGAVGQLLVGYRIPLGVTAPPTITTSVPSVDENGNPISVPLTFTQSPSYAAGLTSLVPPPTNAQWVGYESETQNYTPTGPQTVTLAPSFGLPAGFVGPFTWRTVVGFRHKIFAGTAVTCPAPFPGVSYPSPVLTTLPSVCIDSPDLATINGAPSSLATGDLAITPPATPKVAAGSKVSLAFVAVLTGGNPAAGGFSTAVSTTIPGVTLGATPATFVPAANSQTPLAVSFTVPASTPPGTYDVTLSASVAGQTRGPATAHITVTAGTKTAAAGVNAAKLKSVLKTTTLKVAKKTGISLTLTLSRKSAISLVGAQTKPKVSVTVKKTLKAGKKTVVLIKSAKFHKGKVRITFKGGGLTKVFTTTLN
jgi:hypothetical protein